MYWEKGPNSVAHSFADTVTKMAFLKTGSSPIGVGGELKFDTLLQPTALSLSAYLDTGKNKGNFIR